MPLTYEEDFVAKLQKHNRVQIPVLIRWKHKLECGDVLRIRIYNRGNSEYFYAKLSVDGRFTIPHVAALELEAEPGEIIKVTITPVPQT